MNKQNGFYLDIKYAANILDLKFLNWPMGKNILFEHLRKLQILQDGKDRNKPYPHYYSMKYFETIIVEKNNKTFRKTVITEKGLNWLKNVQRPIIELNEREYWKEKYPKDYTKLLEEEI